MTVVLKCIVLSQKITDIFLQYTISPNQREIMVLYNLTNHNSYSNPKKQHLFSLILPLSILLSCLLMVQSLKHKDMSEDISTNEHLHNSIVYRHIDDPKVYHISELNV